MMPEKIIKELQRIFSAYLSYFCVDVEFCDCKETEGCIWCVFSCLFHIIHS